VVVAPGEPALADITKIFGVGMLTPDGQLNRRALRDHIFSSPAARKTLEGILHPKIQAEMARRAAAVTAPYLIMAIPLLVEGGNFERFDRILVVDVDEETQMKHSPFLRRRPRAQPGLRPRTMFWKTQAPSPSYGKR
jgi:dephospho-CoA kinase